VFTSLTVDEKLYVGKYDTGDGTSMGSLRLDSSRPEQISGGFLRTLMNLLVLE
jgi:hypothetical protein